MKKIKIAQVAPTWYNIPPKKYGGAEVIIAELANNLPKLGYDVTLFATGDSKVECNLVSVMEKSPGISQESLTNFKFNMEYLFNHFLTAEKQSEFDLIHWHVSKDLLPMMLANFVKTPSVITFHNYFHDAKTENIFKYYADNKKSQVHYVSVSNNYTKHFPFDFYQTVYNGIDLNDFKYSSQKKDYALWVGRFLPVKGAHLAVKIASNLNISLKMAARESGSNLQKEYFDKNIKSYLNEKIKHIGEVGFPEKEKIYQQAKVLINPILFDEPFGLVVVEAMACGTPVIAFNMGSMAEIIDDGVNGFLVKPNDISAMEEAVKKIYSMSKLEYLKMSKNCRQTVEKKFTAEKMVDGYNKIYKKILNNRKNEES